MRKVLVTGASSGLGRDIAARFLQQGDSVILSGRNEEALRITRGSWPDKHTPIVVGDISAGPVREELYKHCTDLDVLVNCAGRYLQGPFHTESENKIAETVDTNLTSLIILTRTIYHVMVQRKRGLILNIGSAAARPGNGEMEAVYAATKAGLEAFSRTLRREALLHNVRVMHVTVGAMDTAMMQHRANHRNFISPVDVARCLVDLSYNFESMQIDSIDLSRMR
jgi:short-subunit dehydrogenase